MAALPDISTRFDAAVPLVRQISLEGVRIFAAKSDSRRRDVAAALRMLSWLVVPLFAVLMFSVVVLSLMVRAAGIRNRRIAGVSNRLHSLFEASIDAILVARPDGRILSFNAAAQRIYGYEPAEAIGGDMVELLTPDDQQEAVRRLLAQVRDGMTRPRDGGPDIIKATARHKSGLVIPVELSISVAAGERGPLLVAFVRDVSRRTAEEAELIEARDRAVAGEEAKARMIAVMSHEMRTPLNGVLGLMDLLSLTPLDDRQRRYLTAMDHSGRMLLRHVNDVLDSSRARGGGLVLALEPVDLPALIDDALEGLRAQAQASGNRLTVAYPGTHGSLVMCDAARMQQIVVNLVGNAIKFTEDGVVHVELDCSDPDGWVELRVSDTGIGIAADKLDQIFDEFVTLGSTFDRKVEGTGLGLAIVKGLVEGMEGQITVESTLGHGTLFRVHLPLSAAPEQPAPEIEAPNDIAVSPGLQVLMVEDNAVNRLVAGEMLRRQGCHVTEARDGVEGVQIADRQRFDLILMDISMPRMNGIEAARQIRSAGMNRNSPIVALTAHAMPEDLARFREAGMDRTLVKPLTRADLALVVHGLQPISAAPDSASGDLVAALGPQETSRLLLARIRDELQQGLDRLDAAREPDADRAVLARRLAGSAGAAGLQDLRFGLVGLEQSLLSDAAPDVIRTELRRLRRMLGQGGGPVSDPGPSPRRHGSIAMRAHLTGRAPASPPN